MLVVAHIFLRNLLYLNQPLLREVQAGRARIDLALPFLLSSFISGITPELRCEVQALQPLSLPQVVALAKL